MINNIDALENLLAEMPKLHWWGHWSTGGLSADGLRELVNFAFEEGSENVKIIETGAGLSTLAFMSQSPKKLITFALEEDLLERVKEAALQKGYETSNVELLAGHSEILAPIRLQNECQDFSFGLIDGGHNFTSTWCDFTFINYCLRKDAILAVDDCQLFSCRTLALYLSQSESYDLILKGKTSFFKKKTDARFERDFGASSYIMANTL